MLDISTSTRNQPAGALGRRSQSMTPRFRFVTPRFCLSWYPITTSVLGAQVWAAIFANINWFYERNQCPSLQEKSQKKTWTPHRARAKERNKIFSTHIIFSTSVCGTFCEKTASPRKEMNDNDDEDLVINNQSIMNSFDRGHNRKRTQSEFPDWLLAVISSCICSQCQC